jgi:hypothetical protein
MNREKIAISYGTSHIQIGPLVNKYIFKILGVDKLMLMTVRGARAISSRTRYVQRDEHPMKTQHFWSNLLNIFPYSFPQSLEGGTGLLLLCGYYVDIRIFLPIQSKK